MAKSKKVGQIKITQVKSTIGFNKSQKLTMEALGIRKMHGSVVHNATPQILGMVNKVKHLLTVEDVKN